MARMPGAVWKPMVGSSTSRISSYDILCVHTMVGSLAGTDSWFRSTASGTNSHFGVGGDGTIWQWVDTAYRSGANYNGNYHIVSVETADMGAPFGPWAGSDVPAWNEAQIAALGRIARWAHDTHGIPLTQIPDAKPGRRGVGYHRLGVPGYMVAGAEQWSTKQGKACPGDRRIAQVPQVINAAVNGEDDMPTPHEITDYFLNYPAYVGGPTVSEVYRDVHKWMKGSEYPKRDTLTVLYYKLNDLLAAKGVAPAQPAVSVDAAAVAEALASNPDFLAAIAKAVADENYRRQES